ncbi:MAG: D-alanyl-D-alanine carboxypeptidase/D-alanyl-D-alanine endopeptidase [Actinomycetota bacterium]
MLRRALVPIFLVVIAAAASVAAVRADAEVTALAPIGAPRPITPVLSARRVPSVVSRPLGDRRLIEALTAFAARLPNDACLVVDEGGRRLLAHDAAVPLIGASTQKLLTATVALEHFGPDHRLATVAKASGVSNGVVDGDLFLVGGGDPLLQTADYTAAFDRQPLIWNDLAALADAIVEAGVRAVGGRVVGDESRYDRVRYVPSWRSAYVADNDAGPLSALSVNDGFAAWAAPLPREQEDNTPAPDPALYAAEVLTRLLEERGVAIGGAPGTGTAPSETTAIATLPSLTIGEIVAQMLTQSDNTTAEMLLKEIGVSVLGEGSTAAGARAAAEVIAELRLPGDGAVIVDGSGLERADKVTCQLLVAMLERVGHASDLADGLAIAGVSGTLGQRFRDTPVAGKLRAKTGSLFDVAALAGFVDGHSGNILTFALVTNSLARLQTGFDLQDELAHLLVRYPDVPGVDALGPLPVPASG